MGCESGLWGVRVGCEWGVGVGCESGVSEKVRVGMRVSSGVWE